MVTIVSARVHIRRTAMSGLALIFARAVIADVSFEKDIRPIVEKYCYACHDSERMKGDLDLQRFDTLQKVDESVAVWHRIGKRITDHQMPPKKQPQPTDMERDTLLKWIETLQVDNSDCDKIANEESVSWYPGYVMSRRLNRAEYQNTIRDLLGIDLDIAKFFPADGAGGEGFDNNGNALFLSAIQVEKFLTAADLAIDTAFSSKNDATRQLITAPPDRHLKPRDAARNAIRDFTARAWRRPTTDAEVDTLLTMYDRGAKRRNGYESGLKLAYKAALVSPNFIFLAEPEPPQQGVYELGDYPLASRLSYFLWSSMPDGELFALAHDGKLRDPQELLRQVRRMVKDPKAKALGEQFATQWLGITQLGQTIKPDQHKFPEFDDAMANDMRAEAAGFFNHVISENRSLLDLINANYTFANARLAHIYGLTGIEGDDLREVQFADANRGGVLGMAAVLTMTSQPLRTSPVLRGKWVLEQLLGDHVPPPPPNVPQLPADDTPKDGLTMRARLEAHRANPDCASCHARMDPIGFGLENFDAIGRWRTELAGQPVDAKGVLPSGEAFSGPQELKQILLARKDDFARNLSRKMLGYALGRSLTKLDDCVINTCVDTLKAEEYRPRGLLEQIVLSYPFRHRYAGTPPDGGKDS